MRIVHKPGMCYIDIREEQKFGILSRTATAVEDSALTVLAQHELNGCGGARTI